MCCVARPLQINSRNKEAANTWATGHLSHWLLISFQSGGRSRNWKLKIHIDGHCVISNDAGVSIISRFRTRTNFIRFLGYSAAEAQSLQTVCNVAQSPHGEPHYAHAVLTKSETRGPISVIGYLRIIFESDAHANQANMGCYLLRKKYFLHF